MNEKQDGFLKNESGAAMVIALIAMVVLTVIGLAATFTSTFEILLSGEKKRATDAFYAADSEINVIMLDYTNFDPAQPKTFSHTNVVATVNYDPNKKGPPKKFTALNLSYAYFWVGSKGNDSTGMNNKSTCTIDQNVVRLLPKDESILEVVK
jgi:Tfp pilus assembly protein PilX